MRRILSILIVAVIIFASSKSNADLAKDRSMTILFQGHVVDDLGLSVDKKTTLDVWFYNSKISDSSNLIYAESFDNIDVIKGMFRIPLFQGAPIDGTYFDPKSFWEHEFVYVDIVMDGSEILRGHPLQSQLASIRAETAVFAESLTEPLYITEDEIPEHSAQNITTGLLDLSAVPKLNADKITSGIFSVDQIPDLSISKLACISSKFSSSVIPSGLNAGSFTQGTISEDRLPSQILRNENLAFKSGIKNHGQAVGIPQGFSKSECVWLVGLRRNTYSKTHDNFGIDQLAVETDSDGVVHCRWYEDEGDELKELCTVNYLTICKR